MLLREHRHSNIKRIQEEVQVRNYTIKSFTSLGSWEELKQHKSVFPCVKSRQGVYLISVTVRAKNSFGTVTTLSVILWKRNV